MDTVWHSSAGSMRRGSLDSVERGSEYTYQDGRKTIPAGADSVEQSVMATDPAAYHILPQQNAGVGWGDRRLSS